MRIHRDPCSALSYVTTEGTGRVAPWYQAFSTVATRCLGPLMTCSEIILKYSRYEKPQHDRVFFEALMAGLISILDAAFSKLDKRADIEAEIGHLFRSKHFNINHRRYQPARSVDTLSVKELYSIKHETTNRALNAKMLSRLHEKPFMLAVQVASVTNSPLVTQCISSPMVARAQAKDPAERNKLLKVGLE